MPYTSAHVCVSVHRQIRGKMWTKIQLGNDEDRGREGGERKRTATQISMKCVAKKCQNHQRFRSSETPHSAVHCVQFTLTHTHSIFPLDFIFLVYHLRGRFTAWDFSAGDFYTWGWNREDEGEHEHKNIKEKKKERNKENENRSIGARRTRALTQTHTRTEKRPADNIILKRAAGFW